MENNTNHQLTHPDQSAIIQEYLKTLTKKENCAIEIAKNHLESSFDIEKSVGFLEFKKIYKT